MQKNLQLIQLRTRKLGVLLLDARLAKRRSADECARAMSCSLETYTSYENGLQAPSLPELESLAFELDLPLEHFWGNKALSSQDETMEEQSTAAGRNSSIGNTLKQKREAGNISMGELAEKTGLDETRLASFEAGHTPIPIPELEVVAQVLKLPLEDLFVRDGPIGEWRIANQLVQDFLRLPLDLQQFITKPVNRPYLDLSTRLSNLSVEKLRAIAEGLLEITY